MYTTSQFICPKCNHTIPLPRRRQSQRANKHIKDIYCPWCNKVQHTREYKYDQPIRNLAGELIAY